MGTLGRSHSLATQALLPATALAGCASTTWQRPGGAEDEMLQDRYACEQHARPRQDRPVQILRTTRDARVEREESSRRPAPAAAELSLFVNCMRARGYRQVKTSPK